MGHDKAMSIAIERADAPGVLELLEASDRFHGELYPPEGNYLLDVSELIADSVTVVVAREDARAIGMGALVVKADYAEIKRMFLRPEARGSGIADGILQLLETTARSARVKQLRLETGPLQPAALAFYERHGYARIPAFGDYPESEHSLFYGKAL